jgi:hypothetical protein
LSGCCQTPVQTRAIHSQTLETNFRELDGNLRRLRQLQNEIDAVQAAVHGTDAAQFPLGSMDCLLEEEMQELACSVLPKNSGANMSEELHVGQ